MKTNPIPISIAILSGGRSSRFGGNKCFHRIDGKELFLRVFDRLKHLSTDVFLQGLPPGYEPSDVKRRYRISVHPDVVEGGCALGGIASALRNAAKDHVLVVGCDMPFVDPNLVTILMSRLPADAVVPRWSSGYLEPLCSIFSRKLLDRMRKNLESDRRRISDIFESMHEVVYVDIEALISDGRISEHTFRNINTPGDVEF